MAERWLDVPNAPGWWWRRLVETGAIELCEVQTNPDGSLSAWCEDTEDEGVEHEVDPADGTACWLRVEPPSEDPRDARIAARREGAEAVRDAVMSFLDELFPGGPAAHVEGWPHALMECVAVAMSKIPEAPR